MSELTARGVQLPAEAGINPLGLYLGNGPSALEIVTVQASTKPSGTVLHKLWKHRRGSRASPVLLVALYDDKAAFCGPAGDDPPVRQDVDAGLTERMCRELLAQPDRHAALRFLAQTLPTLETRLPAIRNEGLLALHELTERVPKRPDWKAATEKAKKAIGKNGGELLTGLGFRAERLDNLTQVLYGGTGKHPTALALLLDQTESPEAGTARFNSLSPVSYALAKADEEKLPWVIMVQGSRIRLYPTEVGKGVGRKGRTETFVECHTSLLADQDLAYLWLLFSSDALQTNGTFAEILNLSKRFAGDLAKDLRERIYNQVVPALATGIARARHMRNPTAADLDFTYQMALTVLFRLLFIAYAEDRDLLPYRHNEAYRSRSLKQKALELADAIRKRTEPAEGDAHWQECRMLFYAVAKGNPEWGVPEYNGGLFTDDASVSEVGAALAKITLPNSIFDVALRGLLVIDTAEGVPGPVDFRALGVREFGTIYEGLLESELSVAETDLVVDKKGSYVPVTQPKGKDKVKQPPEVRQGDIYLHNRSGSRKSSGSYYTKDFAVEHLLDKALEPALDDHLQRLSAMGEADATEAFFDFRVADIAMGSGHFLVAAIDRIEKRFAEYIGKRQLPGLQAELMALRSAAKKELGDMAEHMAIEDGQLLRRLIARRCIYGVDLNNLSVQLSRLSIWIHTFVPGLPLSLLDHNLVHGNALVGVGTVDEILQKFQEAGVGLFAVDAENLLGEAAQPLRKLAKLADATIKDIRIGRNVMEEARLAIGPTKALCDIIIAQPIAGKDIQFQFGEWSKLRLNIQGNIALLKSRELLEGLYPLHFPVAFPEVFLRARRPGFDVILGNPPWEEIKAEERSFWTRHFPGLRSLPQRELEEEKVRLRETRPDLYSEFKKEEVFIERMRHLLATEAFPGIETGDSDVYKAFCWRFWNLVATSGGRIGVVLPRSALAAKGSTLFRKEIFTSSSSVDVTMLLNSKKWVFEEVHPQYTIGLLSVMRGMPENKTVKLSGPYASLESFNAAKLSRVACFSSDEVQSWNDTASLPLLPTEQSLHVFTQLRQSPRLDLNNPNSWRARPDREMDATNQKDLMDLSSEECPAGFWPVYKGESFDLWSPDTGTYYAWANPTVATNWLQSKRLRGGTSARDSAHSEFDISYLRDVRTLPCYRPRIAFRNVTRSTDTRTLRTALIPPNVFIQNGAPYLLWPRGDEGDQAFLLGVMSSLACDWYARRFVEVNFNYFLFNPIPIPRPDRSDFLRRRVVELSGRLAAPDNRFAAWAKAVGVKHGKIPEVEKQDMIHELDAVVAHLYGLNEKQLIHIFETFHEGWDYDDRLKETLKYFSDWKKKRDAA